MAAATTTSTAITVSTTHFKPQTKPSKHRRKKCRETTISAAAHGGDHHRSLDPPTVVDSPESSWCCPTAPPPPTRPRQDPVHGGASNSRAHSGSDSFRVRLSLESLPAHTAPPPPTRPRQDPDHGGASNSRAHSGSDSFRVRLSLESLPAHGGASPPRSSLGSDSFRVSLSLGSIQAHGGASPSRASLAGDSFRLSIPLHGGACHSRASSGIDSLLLRPSPGTLSPAMDFTRASASPPPHTAARSLPNGHESGFYKFNSALTAGLLNPMSPPPPPATDKTRSSPTLFEMMANEPEIQIKTQIHNNPIPKPHQISIHDKQALTARRVAEILASRSPGNQFNDAPSSDIELTLSSKDGVSVSLSVHRQILVAHSRFFAVKLSDRWAHQRPSPPYVVEIADCDDVEVYIETLRLMYCKDLRRRLMKEDVSKVLGILKVSAAIGFDAGVLTCLEFLEASPWAEDEEEKVALLLSELRLEGVGAGEVLKRVSLEAPDAGEVGNEHEGVLLKLINLVLEGKDEKARREMKLLISKMLHESSSQNDLRKDALYSACDACLNLLRRSFLSVARSQAHDREEVGQVARQADNLHWILDILIDKQIAEDFLKTWASESELAESHCKVPAVHRHEISRVTARLFVGIGKGQLLASKEARLLLLKTWLGPFYDDFGWMRRAAKGLDRNLIEDGLNNTILTLPLACQQEILLAWFNRFLNSGEDCPNIQRGFEVWWRRAFWRRNGEHERLGQIRVTNAAIEHP